MNIKLSLHFSLFVVITGLCFTPVHAQELGFLNSWNVGLGVSFNNIRSVSFVEFNDDELRLARDLRNGGATRGLQISFANFSRLSRHVGIFSEVSLMHSRKKGYFEEELSQGRIIYIDQGLVNYSNLLFQIHVAPRVQFGRFNRYFVSLGPYIDQNIWNFSTNNGYRVSYFEKVNQSGKVELIELDQPEEKAFSESSSINPIDFGGIFTIGTLLALPGKNLIQVEFRYSRGAFRISDIPGVRQNRFSLVCSYAFTKPIGDSYLKYMPY